jgi:hypothetical protein
VPSVNEEQRHQQQRDSEDDAEVDVLRAHDRLEVGLGQAVQLISVESRLYTVL